MKLILPLPYHIDNQRQTATTDSTTEDEKRDNIQPLALLVHPQQPLSYLERLLQAEIPPIKRDGIERVPSIYFRAEAEHDDSQKPDNVASYSGLGHEGPQKDDKNWVRWSGSTDVGDFIRDAARGREFAVDIEGYDKEVRVAVPSFKDRTYYMRMRLRKMSRRINQLAQVKQECDMLAHRGAHRIAKGGFYAMASYWGFVCYAVYFSDLGWSGIEPVTYLAGLATIMSGYLWFLYVSRDLSYRAVLNLTVSRRQSALYEERGFDPRKWEQLVHETNSLRGDIRIVATEYDVDWDEMKDLGGEEVKEVLEKEKKKRRDDDEEEHALEEKKDSGKKEKE